MKNKQCPFCRLGMKDYHNDDPAAWTCAYCHMEGNDKHNYELVEMEHMEDEAPPEPEQPVWQTGISITPPQMASSDRPLLNVEQDCVEQDVVRWASQPIKPGEWQNPGRMPSLKEVMATTNVNRKGRLDSPKKKAVSDLETTKNRKSAKRIKNVVDDLMEKLDEEFITAVAETEDHKLMELCRPASLPSNPIIHSQAEVVSAIGEVEVNQETGGYGQSFQLAHMPELARPASLPSNPIIHSQYVQAEVVLAIGEVEVNQETGDYGQSFQLAHMPVLPQTITGYIRYQDIVIADIKDDAEGILNLQAHRDTYPADNPPFVAARYACVDYASGEVVVFFDNIPLKGTQLVLSYEYTMPIKATPITELKKLDQFESHVWYVVDQENRIVTHIMTSKRSADEAWDTFRCVLADAPAIVLQQIQRVEYGGAIHYLSSAVV
jgi:hypothetical protein